jgi:hypothetical protein
MQEILFEYKLTPTTWAYISALMMIGTYFKFQRFWSVRNLDLMGLICFSPGLLLIYYGLDKHESNLVQAGYVWLFVVGGCFLVRLLVDPVMVRRPLLERPQPPPRRRVRPRRSSGSVAPATATRRTRPRPSSPSSP